MSMLAKIGCGLALLLLAAAWDDARDGRAVANLRLGDPAYDRELMFQVCDNSPRERFCR